MRKDFVEGEAELSGSEEVEIFSHLKIIFSNTLAAWKLFILDASRILINAVQGSDDEDERGLDQFEEMEGDLDDIDEDKERDKVAMISFCSKLSKVDLF